MAETKTGTSVQANPGGKQAFPPFEAHTFPSQILWFVLFFGALYLVLARVALPKLGAVIEGRAKRIADDLETAANAQKSAQAASAAYDKTLGEAKGKAQAMAQDMRNKLSAETDAKRKALEADLNGKLATAEAQIAATKAQAMTNVAAIAKEAAGDIVKQLTGQTPDPAALAAAIAAGKPA